MTQSGKQQLQHIDTGIHNYKDACVVIVKTEWNSAIVDTLESSCIDTLHQYGVHNIKTVTVPGAVEIPFACRSVYQHNNNVDVIITLGCVIKGGTPHFEYVCKLVTEGILQLNMTLPIPVIFGILTVDFIDQAKARIGGRDGDKGVEAALTALKMIPLKMKK
jgi:6,7-dimethyl-8-ribityllumazine synthase